MACERANMQFGDQQFTGFICTRGYRPKTWQCECGKRTPNAERVCRHCGLYRDGCPKCDSDMIPAVNPATLWNNPNQAKFTPGVKRWHVCKSCGHQVMA